MPAIPTPPPDASGGFLLISYTMGSDTHRMRLHVAPFNYATGTRWNYNPTVGGGTEVTPFDTFNAFAAQLKNWIKTTDAIHLQSLYQIDSGVPVERFGWTQPNDVAGVDTGAIPTDAKRAAFYSFNFKSVNGGRAKVVIIGGAVAGAAPTHAVDRFSTLGASSSLNLVNYLASAACGAVCHDGAKFSNTGDISYGINRKLRRKYGFS